MEQKDKQLLFKDLCSRLLYKPFAQWYHKALNKFCDVRIMEISTYGKNIDDYDINVLCQPEPGVDYKASIIDIKPYLRSMSSMTEEESAELSNIISEWYDKELFYLTEEPFLEYALSEINYSINPQLFDWLNAHHFDYRGLIKMGLALEAPEGMYKAI